MYDLTVFTPKMNLSLLPGAELVHEDPLELPFVAPRAPSIPTPSTHHPLLTIIETTKESLSKATEAGVPCLSDRGSDDCDDDGLVISGYGSGKAMKSYLPPLMMMKIFTRTSPC